MTAKREPDRPMSRIRPATGEDTEFILSLVPRFVAFELPKGRRKRETRTALEADIARALEEASPADHFFIAEDAGANRMAFSHLQLQRDFFSGVRSCHISDLAVADGHDGHGIGHALIEHAQGWARDHRCKLLTLSVFPGNARARALYERSGFRPDLIRMAKPLGGRTRTGRSS